MKERQQEIDEDEFEEEERAAEEEERAALLDRFGDLDAEERAERAAERRRSHPDPAWR